MKRKWTVSITLIIVALWSWTIFIEPYLFLEKSDVSIQSEKFPDGFQNIKIAIVSDFHIGRGPLEKWRAERILKAVNAQEPDIILFLGDYTNGYFYQSSLTTQELTEYLSRFSARIGKFGVLGNHDIAYGEDLIMKVLADSSITLLRNSNAFVSTPHGDIYIAGINDALTSNHYSYSAALNGIPHDAPVIFLTHVPVAVREVPKFVDVVLAGHTHGGQLRLPFIGNIFPLKHSPREIVAGLSKYEGHQIFTSRGLGTSRFPVRFFCPPEFTILRISPKK